MPANADSRNVVLAFFDVLGFADRVANGEAPILYEKYRSLEEDLARVCTTSYSCWVPRDYQEFCNNTEGFVASLRGRQPIEWVPAARIGKPGDFVSLHFSDTMLFWSDDCVVSNGEFFDIAIDFFCRALEIGVPLRGAIATGELLYDKERSIVIGGALVEAAKAESAQAWCGIGLAPSLKGKTIVTPDDRVLRFSAHVKPGREDHVLSTVIDWTWHWRNRNPEVPLFSVAEKFGRHPYWTPTLELEQMSREAGHLGALPIHDLEIPRA